MDLQLHQHPNNSVHIYQYMNVDMLIQVTHSTNISLDDMDMFGRNAMPARYTVPSSYPPVTAFVFRIDNRDMTCASSS